MRTSRSTELRGTGFQPVFAAADAKPLRRKRVEHGLKTRATKSPRPAAIDVLAAALPAGESVVRGFATGVADQLAAGPLSHDRRKQLFARAATLGLGRFEANLIIAIAERGAGLGRDDLAVGPRLQEATTETLSHRAAFWTVGIVQSLILGAVWWALRS